jgi:hypothetical protein
MAHNKAFTPGMTALVSVAAASARVQIDSAQAQNINDPNLGQQTPTRIAIPGSTLYLYNPGTIPVFVALGDQNVAAVVPTATPTLNSFPIPPGAVVTLTRNVGVTGQYADTHIAYIAASATSLYISEGHGE